jgi:protein TonB
MTTLHAAEGLRQSRTRNEAWKEGFQARFWLSMIVAVVLHFVVFAAFPTLRAADSSTVSDKVEIIPIYEVKLPEPPEPIARPAVPSMGGPEVPHDLTIADNVGLKAFDAAPPPPPPSEGAAAARPGAFVPYTVGPRLLNPDEVARAAEREYPAALRDARIGGEVTLEVHVGTDGEMLEARLAIPSGYEALDRAALRVAEGFRFSPALNRDKVVAVWVSLPVRFTARDG